MNNRDKVSCERGLEKEDVGYIHNGILLSHKKKAKILPFVTTQMDLENIILRAISQSEKAKNHMVSFRFGI